MSAALVTTIIVITALVPVIIVMIVAEKKILIPRKRRRKVCPLYWTDRVHYHNNNHIEHKKHFINVTIFVMISLSVERS